MNSDKSKSGLKTGLYDLIQEDESGALRSQPVRLFVPEKKEYHDAGGWFVQWQEATMILARNKDLTLTDWRIIAVLQSKLDFDNWIRLSQVDIGREIDVAQPNVSASMRRLISLQVVLLGPATRNVKTYRLNPELLFKGTMRNALKAKSTAPKFTVIKGGK